MKDPILEFERIDRNVNELFGGLGSTIRKAFQKTGTKQKQAPSKDVLQRSQELQQKYAEKYGGTQRVYSKGKIVQFPVQSLIPSPSPSFRIFVKILTGSQLQSYNKYASDIKSGLFATNLERLNRLATHGVLDEEDASDAEELIGYVNGFKKAIVSGVVDRNGKQNVEGQNRLWQRILELSKADKVEIPETLKKTVTGAPQQTASQQQASQKATIHKTIPVKKQVPEGLILRKMVVECLKNC